MKILVTGATGFVGQALCRSLFQEGHSLRLAVRHEDDRAHALGKAVRSPLYCVGDINATTNWNAALQGIEAVIHLAALVHQMDKSALPSLADYRAVNREGTAHLARSAVNAGVRRLLFLSSIKVNGEITTDQPFTEACVPAPEDPYGISKWEAEQALAGIARDSGLEVVVLRPTLMYGAGVKGNFLRLMSAVNRRLPLPLGAIRNKRSLLYLGNLIDAITLSINSPQAAGKTFLVSDGEDYSTSELILALAKALKVRPILLPVPPFAIRITGKIMNKNAEVHRLLSSLQVDSRKIRTELAWTPRFRLADGIEQTAAWFRNR
ncbi:MAG: SDR family oxidoreductase [Pseudomonadota bacterium]